MSRLSPLAPVARAIELLRRVDRATQRTEEQQEHVRQKVDALTAEVESLRADLSALTANVTAATAAVDESRRTTMIAARRLASIRGQIRVVFLVHNHAAWGSIAELVQLMQADRGFEPIVVSIPHHYSGMGPAKGEGRTHRFLKTQRVPHIRLHKSQLAEASQLLRALDPDIIVRQSQWDADIDPAFSADALGWSRVILIPYETMNTTENVPIGDPPINSAVDTDMHRTAWLVFLANDEALRIARRDSLTGGLQFRAVGHPKLDYHRGAAAEWPFDTDTEARPRRILWSAHHSILTGWNDFGMFPSVCEGMLAWAREATDVQFVLTHHPLLPDTIAREGSSMTTADFATWLAAWEDLENTAFWRGDYTEALAATDVLLTDGPSMMIEGQVMGVPTIFLERPDHIPFNEIGQEIALGVHRVSTVEAARRAIDAIAEAGADPLAEKQKANVERYFGQPGAASRILEVIREQIEAERLVTSATRS